MIEPAVERAGLQARRDVVSFVRRSNRMRPNQRRAWEAYRDRFVLQVPRLDTSTSVHPTASLDLVQSFGRDAELIVEIGPAAGGSFIRRQQPGRQQNFWPLRSSQPASPR